VRASEILEQSEPVAFLQSRFPKATKQIGRPAIKGTETVEARVPANSREFGRIRDSILKRRAQGLHGFSDFPIGWYLRKYSKQDLQNAEVLRLTISSHFEPSGEECGTIYETLCNHCNWGRQVSDLVLDLRQAPQHQDVSVTIAWVGWVVSSRFVQTFTESKLTGADFQPIFDLRNPTKPSAGWRQLRFTGSAGELAENTKLGRDPFSPSQTSWRCPIGHLVVTAFLPEVYLHRDAWNGSDIAVTTALLGQGRNFLRPAPLIAISQRMYRALEKADIKGLSCECVHLL
jgi:hypothetical protein